MTYAGPSRRPLTRRAAPRLRRCCLGGALAHHLGRPGSGLRAPLACVARWLLTLCGARVGRGAHVYPSARDPRAVEPDPGRGNRVWRRASSAYNVDRMSSKRAAIVSQRAFSLRGEPRLSAPATLRCGGADRHRPAGPGSRPRRSSGRASGSAKAPWSPRARVGVARMSSSWSCVAGNPARVVGRRDEAEKLAVAVMRADAHERRNIRGGGLRLGRPLRPSLCVVDSGQHRRHAVEMARRWRDSGAVPLERPLFRKKANLDASYNHPLKSEWVSGSLSRQRVTPQFVAELQGDPALDAALRLLVHYADHFHGDGLLRHGVPQRSSRLFRTGSAVGFERYRRAPLGAVSTMDDPYEHPTISDGTIGAVAGAARVSGLVIAFAFHRQRTS